jgi:hypothetical protein
MSDSDAPLKVIINGQEFDETEAQDLIDAGKKTREMEQKWNTKLDSVWPEYGRSRETLKQMESELAEAKTELEKFQLKQKEGSETPQDEVKAKEAARKLGIVLNEDLGQAGYIKKDDLEKYLSERDQNRQAAKAVLAEADKLATEINGSDGRPKFNKRAVMAYASTYGKTSLLEAYNEMHDEDLTPWKERQIALQKQKSLKTLGANGSKSPNEPKVNDSNFKDQLKEALWGAKEE